MVNIPDTNLNSPLKEERNIRVMRRKSELNGIFLSRQSTMLSRSFQLMRLRDLLQKTPVKTEGQ